MENKINEISYSDNALIIKLDIDNNKLHYRLEADGIKKLLDYLIPATSIIPAPIPNKETLSGTYLINTDNWFYGKDGKQYKAAWGEVKILTDSVLGIKTNARSTNWFARVGTDDNHIIIAGCQIHYSIKCDKPDTTKLVPDYIIEAGDVKNYDRPNSIYILE